MLKLKEIVKNYTVGDTIIKALRGIDLAFSKCEFVSILGPSGCGKTTLLNIIGGLDRYTTGDLIINGKSTKDFQDNDWDSYRNNSIGFVFQNYNLIPHLNVIENVELALTLSGVPDKERKEKSLEVLEKVGLADQVSKRPNQLSGGQQQRVAIARALVNDPNIILADEPTGSLDTNTSKQIMDLLKEIAKERLVIMVTHNNKLAVDYSTRLIKLLDGKVIDDSNDSEDQKEETLDKAKFGKKSSMSLLTSLKLSFKNLFSKKARTILTSFAGSIGIIGIALVLAISNGFNLQLNYLESKTLTRFPITIIDGQTISPEVLLDPYSMYDNYHADVEYPEEQYIYPYDPSLSIDAHYNNISQKYIEYLDAMDKDLYNSIALNRRVEMNILGNAGGELKKINITQSGWQELIGVYTSQAGIQELIGVVTNQANRPELIENEEFLDSQYDVVAGRKPQNMNELVLVVDKYNRLSENCLQGLGFNVGDVEAIDFEEILGIQYKIIPNNIYYQYDTNTQLYKERESLSYMYNSESAIDLEIVGIMRISPNAHSYVLSSGLVYTKELTDHILEISMESNIAQAQLDNKTTNVLTGETINMNQYNTLIKNLGSVSTPSSICIHPKSFSAKEDIKLYLDGYNEDKVTQNHIVYIDLAELLTGTMGSIITGITSILIAFAAISLVVSSIMIGIITYVSVLERTKEIGVLRSIGARKKDISRIFISETLIIGSTSGLMGVVIAYLITIPVNIIVGKLVPDLVDIASLKILHASSLVIISMILTLISGLIPAKYAAKKDPVDALRTE